MRAFVALLCMSAAFCSVSTAAARVSDTPGDDSTNTVAAPPVPTKAELKREAKQLRKKIRKVRVKTWHWQDASVSPRSSTKYQERYWNKPWRLKLLLKQWQKRLKHAKHKALHPPYKSAWRCLRKHEAPSWYGGWKANTGNGYYGGLQMRIQFMLDFGRRLYLRKGNANKWTPHEQMWVAEHGRRNGGFRHWPKTSIMCGLR